MSTTPPEGAPPHDPRDGSTGGVPVCYRHPDRESHIRCQRCERPICPDCMNPASVGFQCPECVLEGRRTQRQARSTYGGLVPTKAGRVSFVLLAINVAVWALVLATGSGSSWLVDLLGLRPQGLCQAGQAGYDIAQGVCDRAGGTWLPGFADGAWWQLITSAFLHVQLLHIGFNMFALYILGPQLERMLGSARFLALYLVSALAGSALVVWLSNPYQTTLGASGAIFGLMGALLLVAWKQGLAYQQILIWIGLNFVITFVGSGSISWQGHLGGFVGGLACAAVLVFTPRGPRRPALQWAGLVLIGVVALAAAGVGALAA
ncbi:rhomboid family intramembrane serine protease [Nocardioides bruguierae]|uniref:rhomboid family intramembrane serine protease n=1 Tax=Nocardioides bruguierae TaxID=2945102 RepID=UPI00202282A9|nr:rhomboid family intramembrane serine protease [Nocardioides bruguierae]MCL8026735.1 rhomboid family intramembrane serine protease [Nocardioides bruguierae]